jgi:hypothetical protein
MAQAALMRPTWLIACGKLPIISPLAGVREQIKSWIAPFSN